MTVCDSELKVSLPSSGGSEAAFLRFSSNIENVAKLQV